MSFDRVATAPGTDIFKNGSWYHLPRLSIPPSRQAGALIAVQFLTIADYSSLRCLVSLRLVLSCSGS